MTVLTEKPLNGNGRVAKIVRWLIDNQERVSRPERVQLTFDCAGRSVEAELKEREKVGDPSIA